MHARSKIATGLIFILLTSGCTSSDSLDYSRTVGLPIESSPAPTTKASSIDPELFAKLKADEDKAWGRDTDSPEPEPTKAKEDGKEPAPSPKPVEDVPDNTPVVDSPVTLEPSVIEKAYAQVASLFDRSYTDVSQNIIAHESIEDYIVSDISGYLADAISTWDESHGILEFDVVVFRQDSAAWADEIRVSRGDRIARGSFVEDVKISSSGPHCGFAYILPGIVYLCISDSGANIDYLDSIVAHEYFHIVQHSVGINHINLPIWIGEGSAALLGDMHQNNASQIYSRHANTYNAKMLANFGYSNLKDFSDHITAEDVNLIYTKLEAGSAEQAQSLIAEYNAYLFGAVAMENLIGNYGYDVFIDFLEEVGAGAYWKTSFEQSYGMSTSEFYQSMLTYITDNY